MAEVLDRSAGMGMEIDVDYAHKIMQIPRAKAGAALLVSSGRASAQPGNPADAALIRLAALSSANKGSEQDITDAYAAQLAALCAPHEQALIQQIAAIVAEAGDFDEALAGIEALKAANPKWAEAMAQGMAAADLAGRSDVEDGQ